jgi:acylphosphatase
LISGTVQGVFFRREIMERANRLGLTGWVRNLKDGQVEAVVEGEKQKVDELVRYSHRGPPNARVSNVRVEWLDYTGEFRNFKITK